MGFVAIEETTSQDTPSKGKFVDIGDVSKPSVSPATNFPLTLQTGGEGDAFPGVREEVKPGMPYSQQMLEMARTLRGYGKGAVSQIAGTPGDIEQAGRLLYNLGVRKSGANLPTVEEKPYFKTTEQRAEQFFDKPKTPGEKAGMALGETFGLPTALGLTKRAGVKLAEKLVGRTTETAAEIANKAEKLGFKLEPRQVRQAEPLGSPGFAGNAESNQRLANQLASKATGVRTDEISRDFIGKRLKDLGTKYSEIFDREIKVDRSLVDDLKGIAEFENRVRPADVRSATLASSNLIKVFEDAQASLGRPISAVKIDGRELQRLRTELSRIARTAPVGDDRRIAGQFVDAIDANIARNDAKLGETLATTNRQYAATKTLEDMVEKGTIYQGNISLEKLADNVAANAYGFGSGTSKHPLTDIAIMGRELGIRGIFEGAKEPAGELAQIISKSGRFVAPVVRTQAARSVQRAISGPEGLPTGFIATLPETALEAGYKLYEDRKK